jgi:hypothetical protein
LIKNRWLQQFSGIDPSLPHGSNLTTKLRSYESLNPAKRNAVDIICSEYLKFLNVCLIPYADSMSWVKEALSAAEHYLKELNSKNLDVFSHQSDFKSSVIPEFLYLMFKRLVAGLSLNLEVAAQKHIVIESMFIPRSGEPVTPKFKRVDVAILRPCSLSVDKMLVQDFAMPVVAVENKTNIDKNMIAGVEHSVESLKKTFPLCKYYLVGEFADFAVESQNYAATFIDEILILRKQKRSEVRGGRGNISRIDLDLLLGFKNEIEAHLTSISKGPSDIRKGMRLGRLIREE